MKIVYYKIIGVLLCLLTLPGCSQDVELIEGVQNKESNKISDMINDFYHRLHPDTRSVKSFKILRVETKNFDGSDNSKTRTNTEMGKSSYEIHTVTLDFGESTGYAILSDTPGINHLFYYTEDGCINDTAVIAPLKEMVEAIPALADTIMRNGYEKSVSETRGYLSIEPLVRFKWHQDEPFNLLATYCTCEECSKRGNHKPAGCVPVALAQVIATMKHFKGTFYGNRFIDFDSFPSTAYSFSDEKTKVALGHFLQEIALNCQIQYGCDGSSTSLYPATYYMRDLGYGADLKEGGLDKTRYINYLQCGFPHIMTGSDGDEGHAWILDGAMESESSLQYHINWGWGPSRSNGWSSECFYGDFHDGIKLEHVDYPKKHLHLYLTYYQ